MIEMIEIMNKAKMNLLYIPPLFNGHDVLPSATVKPKLSAGLFTQNSNFDDSGI